MTRELRDSGVGWLGDTPADWSVVPARALFGERKQKSSATDVHLTPSQKYGVLPQAEYMEITGNKVVLNLFGADNMRHVEAGDYVSHLRSFQGGLEFAGIPGKVSAAYTVLKPKVALEPRFFKYLFKSDLYVQALQTTTDQLRDGQSIRYGQFTLIPLPRPALDEQRAIADYLDRETAHIDAFIAKNEELITLLNERRVSAVTRLVVGLGHAHGNRQEAIRTERTERWEFGPVKRFLRSLDARRIPLSSEERGERQGEYDYYGASGVIDHVDSYLFDEPLVLVSEDGANLLMRSSPIAFPARGKYWVNNHAHILRPVEGDVDFWADRIEALDLAPVVTGAAQPKLTAQALMNLQVSAPSNAEQRRIADEIRDVKAEIGERIKIAERGVTLARERRAALISAAVTGKIDVGVTV